MFEQKITAAPAVAQWDRAMAEYLACEAAEQAFDAGPYRAAIDRAEAQGPMALFDERLTHISDRISDERYGAMWALHDIPAPNLSALLWKLEHLLDTSNDGSLTAWGTNVVDPVLADARRLMARPTDAVSL